MGDIQIKNEASIKQVQLYIYLKNPLPIYFNYCSHIIAFWLPLVLLLMRKHCIYIPVLEKFQLNTNRNFHSKMSFSFCQFNSFTKIDFEIHVII